MCLYKRVLKFPQVNQTKNLFQNSLVGQRNFQHSFVHCQILLCKSLFLQYLPHSTSLTAVEIIVSPNSHHSYKLYNPFHDCIVYGFEFKFILLLDYLPTMAKEQSLLCYLIHNWVLQ